MEPNVVKHLALDHKKWKYRALLHMLKKKRHRRGVFHQIREYYYEEVFNRAPLPQKNLEELADCSRTIQLQNCSSRNGNVTSYELMCLASMVATLQPKRILEIGTFDGNTTLQLALNAPKDAKIHTIDLPENEDRTSLPVLDSDLQFIRDEAKNRRKYEGTSVASRVTQHFGDSTNFDFSVFAKDGPLDFIFIDGGHSFDCVKSDTENALRYVADGGSIFWHDFTPFFGGVFHFLCELSQQLPLTHIQGTNLVVYSATK